MFSTLDAQYQPYLASPAFPDYVQQHQGSATSQLINSIEFTDLTQVHSDDSTRRRRRSTTAQDKEAATNMRIVSCPPDPLSYFNTRLTYLPSVAEPRTAPLSAPSASAKKSTSSIWRTSSRLLRANTARSKSHTPNAKVRVRSCSVSATS